ncbi:hypothetical protein GCM10029964_052150 [Kibdelosporangium lantanae]
MHGCGADLLAAAQAAGQIRADLTPDELFDLLSGAAWVRENSPPGADGSVRFLQLAMEGLVVR